MTYLREIETKDLPPAPLRDQPAPILQWVQIDQLRIDDRYQRPLAARNWAAIRTIAANFDWCAFGPILCAPVEGGLFAIMDGQHRAHAAAICGIKQVPAMIVPVPPQRQALAFVQINSAVRVTQHQTFRAELAADTPEAMAMDAAVAAGGCQLLTFNPSSATRKPKTLTCLNLVRQIIRKGHAPYLTAVLTGLVAYDKNGRCGLYSDYILAPLVAAVADLETQDAAQITRALQAADPFLLMDRAAKDAAERGKSRASLAKARFITRLMDAQ